MNKTTMSPEVHIERLNARGLGVAVQPEGPRLYVAGTLPGELVSYRMRARRSGARWAVVDAVIQASPQRVRPRCDHALGNASPGPCGGCSLQHMDYAAQLRHKQQQLEAMFTRHGVDVGQWAEPLHANPYGYRHQARLGVRWVGARQQLLVGFREAQSSYITNCHACQVLAPRVGLRLQALADCLASLDAAKSIAQVEVSCGDSHCALIIRHLAPLSSDDLHKLSSFGLASELGIYTQSGGPDSITPLLLPDGFGLNYQVEGCTLEFSPLDFVQNNLTLNRQLVATALHWLAPHATHRAIDLFCGMGNFSLPLAARCARLCGVEVSATSVAQASANAAANGQGNCSFHAADLSNLLALRQQAPAWLGETYDLALLDPPRNGAGDMLAWLGKQVRRRVVYVSCNPRTLVADMQVLQQHFSITRAALVDMFAHTAHSEVMCQLDRRSIS